MNSPARLLENTPATTTYTFEEAVRLSTEYFEGDEIAADKFVSKYALKDKNNHIYEPTPDHMHRRMAVELARIEARYPDAMSEEHIYNLFKDFRYVIPQGSPMSGIGNKFQLQSLSNCFVIESPYDSYGGILKTDQEQVQLMKRRGGVGFDISPIRPRGLTTENAARTTDGIEVFMERFSNSCREVAQNGRRGALMLTISCHHPQIRDFLRIKRDLKKVTGANISIRISDEFMEAVKAEEQVHLRFPVQAGLDSYEVSEYVDAQGLWAEIIESAHDWAEPGLLFWDTVLRRSPPDIYKHLGFGTTSTNPCAEITICPDDSCRLMAINLASFVVNAFTEDAYFDFDRFTQVVMEAQKLMDDLVDLELEAIDAIVAKIEADPEPDAVKRIELELWGRIKDKAIRGRRTGLGITALGDTLAMIGVGYGTEESIEVTESIYRTLAISSYKSSALMARDRGPFPIFDYELEKDHEFISQLLDADEELAELVKTYGRRNIACNTTAPTGTVSLMTRTTSGIEPVFLPSYKRRCKISDNDQLARVDFVDEMGDRWQEYEVFHPGVQRWMDATGETDISKSPYDGSTSADIDWASKIRMQAAAQKWVDHSISNTTNIPKDTPIDVTKDIYMSGWELGCKGVTVYRDGSRSGVLITGEEEDDDGIVLNSAPKRPDVLPCDIHYTTIKGEKWMVMVGLMNGEPYEVFGGQAKSFELAPRYTTGEVSKRGRKTMNSIYDLKIGNGDGFTIKDIASQFHDPNYSATTRLISLSLRHGASIQYVVEQLQKDPSSDMFTFAKCISRVLKRYIKDGTSTTSVKSCPNCGGTEFAYQENCPSCLGCGYQKCS